MRRPRRWLKIVGIVSVLLAVVIALLPTLLSLGIGRSVLRNALAGSINGDAEITTVRVSWFGQQHVEGLRIIDASGTDVASLNVRVDHSLLAIALGRASPIRINVSGFVRREIAEDGRCHLEETFAADSDRAAKSSTPPSSPSNTPTPAATPAPAPMRQTLPAMIITLAGLDLTQIDRRSNQSVSITKLTGDVRINDSDLSPLLSASLAGDTATSLDGRTESGRLSLAATVDHPSSDSAAWSMRGASAKLDITLSGVPVPAANLITGQPVTLEETSLQVLSDDLTERIALTMSGVMSVRGSSTPATFNVQGSVGKLLDGQGQLTLRAATANVIAQADDVPIDTPDVRGKMERLSATIASEDLTRRIEVALQSLGRINGDDTSEFSANLALNDPIDADGEFTFAVENLVGSASGTRVPTSLLQPLLAAIDVDAMRDLGATIDVEAFFPGGIGGDLMLEARSPNLIAEAAARINADQSIEGSKLLVHLPRAHPDLIAALTAGSVFSDRSLDVMIDCQSFWIPAADAAGVRPLSRVAAQGRVIVAGPTTARLAVADASGQADQSPLQRMVALEHLGIGFSTPALGQHVVLAGRAEIAGGSIDFDQRMTKLFDADGTLALAGAKPSGTAKISHLAADTLLAFVPAEYVDLASEVIGQSLSAELAIRADDDDSIHADVTTRTTALMATTAVRRSADGTLKFDRASVDATISPRMAALLQTDSEQPMVLLETMTAHMTLQSITLPGGSFNDALHTSPVSARVQVRNALLESAPGLADVLAINAFEADLTLTQSGNMLTTTIANGAAILARGSAKHDLAHAAINGSIAMSMLDAEARGDVPAFEPNLNVALSGFHARSAEALLGLESGMIANWTGDVGSIDLHVESTDGGLTARAVPAMPHLQGEFAASIRNDMVAITADTSRLVLAREALQEQLRPAATAAPDAAASSAVEERDIISVDDDVPMRMVVKSLEFPLAMISGERFDADNVSIDLALTGGPLKLTSADGIKSTMNDLDLTLHTTDLNKGLQFALKGVAEAVVPEAMLLALSQPETNAMSPAQGDDSVPAATTTPPPADPSTMTAEQRQQARREERARERAAARAAGDEPPPTQHDDTETPAEHETPPDSPPVPAQPMPGRIDITGVLASVVNTDGVLDLAQGRLQMNAVAENVPTAIADALGDMKGLLVAAIGPQMNATFVADDFSSNSGTLDARITTTNGSLTGLLRGREESFRINRNGPIVAELTITPPLRERLLMRIHPILADIRTTEHPLRVTIPTALAAIPADVSKLRAEIEITVGKVQLDSGSTTLRLLSLFGRGDRRTIPGEIEPITAKIHNGIVTYDKFAVRIDRYTLNYSGQIDLVKQEVNLRTEIPLKALGNQIRELEAFADGIAVPLVTRGKFGALKTSIDPNFDIGKAAINAGFKGTLGNLLGGDGGTGPGLLDRIFNRDKKD